MRISDPKIDEVRSASDIIEVISGYVPLKKRGKSFLGLCPFHQEKTPSFTVSAEKQMYYCFGCGAGGNVFTFVMQLEKVSFVEAVRTLAERAGIQVEERSQSIAGQTEYERLYNACRWAALHFYNNLTPTVEGKMALEYFRHRGFTEETVQKFGLGYSMHSWDDLVKEGQKEGIDIATLEQAGLVVKREETSGHYDRFRGRAMFPIFSAQGRVIGFGARKLREDDNLGKYINSPETPIYDKSRTLYGLFQAKDAIRQKESAILVEGYADLISVFQAGIENVVASSGTALTEEQIKTIGRYAKQVTLVYDADSAGSKATMRGVDLVIEGGLEVRVAELPQGEDPDSFVRKQGRPAFEELLDAAVSFLDFKASQFKALGLLGSPDGQTRAVRSIVETIARMHDELKQHFYIKHLSDKYGIYESVLFRELEKHRREKPRQPRPVRGPATPDRAENPVSTATTRMPAVERDLLKVMIEQGNPMVLHVHEHLSSESFTHPAGRSLAVLLEKLAREGTIGWTPETLMNEVEGDEEKNLIASLVFNKYDISKGWREMGSEPEEPDPKAIADRCLSLLHSAELDRLIEENEQKRKDASTRGDPTREYVEKHQFLMKEKHRTAIER